jgi:excisionase family DNA binding protein
LLILPSDAEPIVSLLRNLAASLPCTAALPFVGEVDYRTATVDPWLKHAEAADYLGISKSTLYQYASQEKIECRKLGGRLEYLRSTLDRFKDQQIRPARRCLMRGSIIPSALGSGK